MEMGPGSHGFDAAEAAERAGEAEGARPEQDELAELADTSGETLDAMKTRVEGERERKTEIARASSAEAIADTENGGSGNPESILAVAPASDGERLAAEAAIIAAGGDITDEAAINAAIVSGRGENPGEMRDLSEAEQATVREGLLAGHAADVGIDAEILNALYEFNAENNPDFDPETVGKDMAEFANNMERLKILTERTDGIEMPTNAEEFNALMERFTDENGNVTIPLTESEMAEMGISVDEDGNITLADGTTYSGTDAAPGMPRVSSGGNVVSGYTGGARYEGGANRMNIDLNNLPQGVDGLVEIVYQAEANGDPDMIYGGSPIQPPRPLTEMTVREVRQFQDRMVQAGSASSACGACQVIRSTMDGAISSGLLNPNERFSLEAQTRFTIGKMNERGLERFQNGQIGEMEFMRNLSMEWASFPRDMGGASYYAGDGLNHARVDPQTVLAQLRTIRGSSAMA